MHLQTYFQNWNSSYDRKRPYGMTVIPWRDGKCIIWDFICPMTLAKSHLHHAVIAAGIVASDSEARKLVKYETLFSTYLFLPAAVEAFGALCDRAAYF